MRLKNSTRLYQSLLATLVLLLSMILQAAASGEWQKIGEKQVLPSEDTVNIKISSQARKMPYKALKFHITQGDLKIRSGKVYMSDGQVINLSIQKRVRSGMETREFPIPAHNRSIQKIMLFIQPPIDHSSNVTVYAIKANNSGKKPQ
ncbi:hypothetical protein [Endozoicomonas sp. 4G]|uniref:hypothetical protein n=1 Tax=Endozoicomonas sp. 4G TaxID=2872754 RepID=UPI00207912F4|nr:hypothetical protein [Endozoicomonas sp. 4G]